MLLLLLFSLLTGAAALFVLLSSKRPRTPADQPRQEAGDEGSSSSVFARREDDFHLPDPASPVQTSGSSRPLWNAQAPQDESTSRPFARSFAPGAIARGQAPTVEKDALAAAGGPKTPEEARRVGADSSAFGALFRGLAKHPQLLHALLNNKAAVQGFMARSKVMQNCSSPQAMKRYLTGSEFGADLPKYARFLQENPGTASAVAGSELAKSLTDCPGTKELLADPGSLNSIVSANPAFMQLLADPNVLQALSSDPRAFSAFSNLQRTTGRTR